MKRLLVLLSALSLVACLDVTGPGGSNPLLETFAPSLGIDLADTVCEPDGTQCWKTTANGTFYKDEVVGSGATLFLGDADDSLYVDYTGYLKDGTQFGAGTDVALRAGNVIQGFLDGIADIHVGGTRMIVVPSNLAYGNSRNNNIPPNSTLIFRIKLNSFTGPGL